MNGEGYDPEVLPDVDLGYYLPDDVIEDFLATYLKHSGDSQTSIERITTEFNVHTTYLLFGKFSSLVQTPTQARIRIPNRNWARCHTSHGRKRQPIRNLGLFRWINVLVEL